MSDDRSGDTHNEISGGVLFSTVIQGRDITVRLPPRVTPALSGLPQASPAFTSRAEEVLLNGATTAIRPARRVARADGVAPGR